MSRFLALVLAPLSLLALPGCFRNTYNVRHSEVLFRYVPSADSLLVLEVEHGIEEGDKSPEFARKAADALRGIAEGKRIYPASGEWLTLDLDDAVARADEAMRAPAKAEDVTEQELSEFHEFVDALHVEDHGLFIEDGSHLSLFRLTRLEHLGRMLEIASAFFNRSCVKEGENGLPATAEFPFFDDASRELFRSAIAKDHAWLSAENGAIVLDVPMTGVSAARCLAWIVGDRGAPKPSSEALALYRQVSSLEIADGHVRLKFGDGPKQVVRFTYHTTDEDSGTALIALLEKDGVKLGGNDAADGAFAKLMAPPADAAPPK
jgi:hypothetical protein